MPLGQAASNVPVVMLRQGHRIRARFVAPAPCALIPSPVVAAAMQAMGAQANVPSPWTDMAFSMDSAALGCRISMTGTWSGRDAVIDPEVLQLPGVGLLPVESVVDETTGEVLYDLSRQNRPAPPGPAPVPPPRSGPPPAGGATPSSTATKKWSPGKRFLVGAAALTVLVFTISSIRYEEQQRR